MTVAVTSQAWDAFVIVIPSIILSVALWLCISLSDIPKQLSFKNKKIHKKTGFVVGAREVEAVPRSCRGAPGRRVPRRWASPWPPRSWGA